MLSGKDQLAACVSMRFILSSRQLLYAFCQNKEESRLGKGTIGCVWRTQVFKILALGLRCSHGARHR